MSRWPARSLYDRRRRCTGRRAVRPPASPTPARAPGCAHSGPVNRGDRVLIERTKQQVHLFSVEARRKDRLFGERPGRRGERLVVTFIELEAAHALRHKCLVVVIGKNLPAFPRGEVGNQAAPHPVISTPRQQRLIKRRAGVREGVFPQVQLVALLVRLIEQNVRVWVLPAPDERARVGVRVPARFQPEHVTRNVPLPELIQEAHDLLLPQFRRGAIPDSQPPQGGHAASAGEQVVALDCRPHVGAGEKIDVDTMRRGDINADDPRRRVTRPIRRFRAGCGRAGLVFFA